MRIVLSHPYSGALFWWLAAQSEAVGQKDKLPNHPYYRTLYGDVDRNLDLALACTVVFEEVIIPAVDAPYPEFERREGGEILLPSLGIQSHWDPSRAAIDVVRPEVPELLRDHKIADVLRSIPEDSKPLILEFACIDLVLSDVYEAPIICSAGRRALIERIAELGLYQRSNSSNAQVGARDATRELSEYFEICSPAFTSRTIDDLAWVKEADSIRDYSQVFQTNLFNQGDDGATKGLFEAIGVAWNDAKVQKQIGGAFDVASRAFDFVGLFPGVGTIAGIAGLAGDAGSSLAARQARRSQWYELGTEIGKHDSMSELERSLRDKGFI